MATGEWRMIKRTALITLFLVGINYFAGSQTAEGRRLLFQQRDRLRVDFLKPEYLTVEIDSVWKWIDGQPNFGMFKDNYFITGVPLNTQINEHTADVKFQISIRQRLFNKIMPFNTLLYLTYTQKSFWNFYELSESKPFEDNNYNPSLLVVKPIITQNKLKGVVTFAFEHESNGERAEKSRSCNFFSLSGVYFYNPNFSIQAKLWYGRLGNDNPDLYKMRGYGFIALNYRSSNDKLGVGLIINPRDKLSSFNTQLELNFRFNKSSNQFLFLQWYNGYGEDMLNYDKFSSMLRAGICLKPPMRDFY
jgi:phospholipase A1